MYIRILSSMSISFYVIPYNYTVMQDIVICTRKDTVCEAKNTFAYLQLRLCFIEMVIISGFLTIIQTTAVK